MSPEFQQQMAKATELTRNGRLQEATALIQAALAAAGVGASAGAGAGAGTGTGTGTGTGGEADRRAGPTTRPVPSLDPADVTDLPWRVVPPATTNEQAGAEHIPAEEAEGVQTKSRATPDPDRDRQPAAAEGSGQDGAQNTESSDNTGDHSNHGNTGNTGNTGRILRASFTDPKAGTRHYRLFLPPQTAGRRPPLVVMLHGCNQDPEDFARGTRMDEAARREGFAVLYPGQAMTANPQRCWNWFRESDPVREPGEAALLAAMVRQVIGEHGLDADRVFVAGLSAGGAMAAVLGRRYPELFAAVGVHSGLAPGSASDLPSALLAMSGLDATGLPGGPGNVGAGPFGPDPTRINAMRIKPLGINPMEINPMEINPMGAGHVGAAPRAVVPGDRTGPRPPTIPTIVFHGSADVVVHPRNGEKLIAQATPPDGRTDSDPQPASGSPRGATSPGLRPATLSVVRDRHGAVVAEHWLVHGGPHGWSGGSLAGSFTDPAGPDATAEMVRFFLARDPHRTDRRN